MLNAIIFRMRSGCQWDQLPERYGPKSTVHDWFQRWAAAGIFERIWAVLVAECDELEGRQDHGLAKSGSTSTRAGARPPAPARRATDGGVLPLRRAERLDRPPSPAPHGRSAWRLAPLLTGLLFATGRRTVSTWL